MLTAAATQPTVLVVDDKPANIRLLFDALRDTGVRVLAARDGVGAVEQAVLAQPHLILLDVMMPGIDGFETCRRLKQREETRGIPVIFMTALAEPADKVRGFGAGAADYVTKPLHHEEVLARVRTHLAIRRLQVEQGLFLDFLLQMVSQRSLDDVWETAASFIRVRPAVTAGALWFLEPATETASPELRLSHWEGADPAGWRHAAGTFARIPLEEPLIGRAARDRCQTAALDGGEWQRPGWARDGGIEAYMATPLLYEDEVLGVMATFYDRDVSGDRQERQRWHRIAAGYLSAAITNVRAFHEIAELRRRLEDENRYLREEVKQVGKFGDIVGRSKALENTLEQVALVAPTDATVLVLGESGTGKELIARAIHERSRRADGPLIRVNCAAVPKELFESEFFGHIRGAFTGAVRDRAGRFELADGGTLFLDEVGEIPLDLQSKLLRVLQEGTFERIGEERSRRIDVRVVAATNRDLKQEAEAGRFRQDLFFRLSVFPVEVPPLRQRKEDLPALAAHFLDGAARKLGLTAPPLKERHVRQLTAHNWPGNVRELQNAVERALILGRGRDLVFDLPEVPGAPIAEIPPPMPDAGLSEPERVLTEAEMTDLQRQNILRALEQAEWRIQGEGGAAELLDIRPTTLRSRMQALGIQKPG